MTLPETFNVTCPWCRAETTWRNGTAVKLDGSLLECGDCRKRYIVVVSGGVAHGWRRSG